MNRYMMVDCFIVGHFQENKMEYFKQKGLYRVIGLEHIFNPKLALISSCLDRYGARFEFMDATFDRIDQLPNMIASSNASIVAISTSETTSVLQASKLVKQIKKTTIPVKVVVLGTLTATVLQQLGKDDYEVFLKEVGADYYITSYYGAEELGKLVAAFIRKKGQQEICHIENLYYRERNSYQFTFQNTLQLQLEDAQVNWRSLEKYKKNYTMLRTSVSCPFQCAFCSYPTRTQKYECLSVDHVERQLDQLEKTHHTHMVNFVDDTFNVPKARFKTLLEMMIHKRYSFQWHAFIRAQYLDEETVSLMKQSNCQGVLLGIESGNQGQLDRMNKKVMLEQLEYGILLLKKYSILTIGLFIVGFPGETENTVQDTVAFIQRLKPDFYSLEPWFYHRNTPIHKQRALYGLKGAMHNWSHNTMNSSQVAPLIASAQKQITDSICMSHLPYPYVFQLLDAGYSIEEIRDLFYEFHI